MDEKLISLILGDNITHVRILDNNTIYSIVEDEDEIETERYDNIDTLWMTAKDWILAQDKWYELDVYFSSGTSMELTGTCPDSDECGCLLFAINSKSGIDAMLSVAKWVAFEKGFMKDE